MVCACKHTRFSTDLGIEVSAVGGGRPSTVDVSIGEGCIVFMRGGSVKRADVIRVNEELDSRVAYSQDTNEGAGRARNSG